MSYRDLKSYQQSTIIYDFTVEFCDRYIDKKSRTHDQMVQAARSGKQNIAEGSTQRTSKRFEIKLVGVARASLEELLEDYLDFLRQHSLPIWDKNSAKAQQVRALAYTTYRSYKTYKTYLAKPEEAANAMVCLISQTTYLLDRQITVLEKEFAKKGGWTEGLRKKRIEERKKQAAGWLLRGYAPKDGEDP